MKLKFFIVFIVFTIFTVGVSAAEEYSIDEFDTGTVIDALPDEVREKLPSGELFSAEGFSERFSFDYFWSFFTDTLSSAITPALKNFTSILGLVLLSAALSAFKGLMKSDTVVTAFELVSELCILLTVYKTAVSLTARVGSFLTQLGTVISAMVPTMLAIGTAGGNSTASAVSANAMMIGVTFIEGVAAAGLFPILKLCFGMSVFSGMGSGIRLDGITRLIRNLFTWIMGFIAAAISAVMTFQNSIALKADSLSVRAVKFAASSTVPVAGGIASDAVSAVAGSISLIKGSVGWGGVIILAVMILPVITEILLIRFGVVISSTAADIIGLGREKRMLDEMSGLFGFLAAICVICGLMFIYALALFAKSTTAIAGGNI